jgi:hypothetical protein
MDEITKTLLSQLNGKSKNFTESEMDSIFNEARQEALEEVKALLREHMVHNLLKKINELDIENASFSTSEPQENEPTHDQVLPQTIPNSEPITDINAPDHDESHEMEHKLAEIEILRQQISENEKLLKEIKTPPSEEIESEDIDESVIINEETISEEGSCYYIFGITRADLSILDTVKNAQHLGYPISRISYENIQAIVSEVPLSEYGEDVLQANVEDPKWLEAKALGHQSVLDTLLHNGTVIPMKFCTIYLSEDRVIEVLQEYQDEFLEHLNYFEGKQEWGIKIYYDHKILSEEITNTNERVQGIKEEINHKSEGLAYFARKKLEVSISEEIQRCCDHICQNCHDELAVVAAKSNITHLLGKETTGRMDEMVLNGAYLVSIEKLEIFQTKLEAIKNTYSASGFVFELSGPWPPYNFVTINPKMGLNHE